MSEVPNHQPLRQRDPRRRDREHLGRVAKLPCIACAVRGRRTWPVEVAHVKIGYPEAGWRAFGHSEKSHDWRTVPLCSRDHREGPAAQHGNRGGDERAYWERLGVYPPEFCQALVDAFARGESGDKVVEHFAKRARQACVPRGAMP